MIASARITLPRLILSLSDALDFVHPDIAAHQQRVTYIAIRIAQMMGLEKQQLEHLFLASALHDIGLIRVEDKLKAHTTDDFESVSWHPEVGYRLLRCSPLFDEPAYILRYHHAVWNYGNACDHDGNELPIACHILLLADVIERSIVRTLPVLHQVNHVAERIRSGTGREFQPDCVDAFLQLAAKESFWLDCVYERIYSLLLNLEQWSQLTASGELVQSIAKIFARVVDAMSPWTATHTSGVAATAATLSELFHFSPREQFDMLTAGYLHDLGKLAIPSRILNKPDRLTVRERAMIKTHTYHTFRIIQTIGDLEQINEWASFHHERLDGTGYPFHHDNHSLLLGSRIMAVADVFTALAEDRPYRTGMGKQQVLEVLNDMIAGGSLDGDVVHVLNNNYDQIDDKRSKRQQEYARHQLDIASAIQQPASIAG